VTVSDVEITHPSADEAVARFVGEHDLQTKAATSELLADLVARFARVTVDLRDATFIDSSFLHCLLVADRQAKTDGKRFDLLVAATGNIRNVLSIADLEDVLRIVVADDPPAAGPLPDGFTKMISD